MNIQIFGTTKCFDTKKAQRYFKERGIKFQMIDLKEKEMSRGEFENVSRALGGWQALVDPNAKDKQTLALPARRLEKLGLRSCFHNHCAPSGRSFRWHTALFSLAIRQGLLRKIALSAGEKLRPSGTLWL